MTAEEIATHIYELAGVSEIGEDGIGSVATVLLGESGVCYGTGSRAVEVRAEPWRIVIHHGLTDEDYTHALAWGVAEWWRRSHPDAADCATSELLARCLTIPRRALLEAVHRIGEDPEAIAEEFVCPLDVVLHRLRSLARPASGTRPRPIGVAS